jgi:hypothetical protein
VPTELGIKTLISRRDKLTIGVWQWVKVH